MGIYDRGYFDGDDWRKPGGTSGSQRLNSVIKALVIVNVAIFLLDMFSGAVAGTGPAEGTGTVEDTRPVEGTGTDKGNKSLRLSNFLALKQGTADLGQPGPLDNVLYLWQLLTYGFAHASITSSGGIFHILFNMLFLVMLGRPVEQRLGNAEFLRFYLVAIVVAGLAWLMVNFAVANRATNVGASGAVIAVVFLFVLNNPRETVLLFGVVPVPAWVIGALFLVSDISMAFSRESTVAAESHLAGAAFAAVYHYRNWNFSWMQVKGSSKWRKRKPRLKVHSPEETEDSLDSEADRVLEKLHQQGESSLTGKERKVLAKYSRKVRKSRDH